MSDSLAARVRVGRKLGKDLTVLGKVNCRSCDPVYLVWHHPSWCPMACKVYRSPRRARREARALSVLRHPNLVRTFGFFEPSYMLMEFLDGPTLRSFIDMQPHGRMAISDAIRVAIYLGSALEYVHANGFLHMDVKSSNVIIAGGRPVLFDFGAMRPSRAERPAQVAGTDPYIAPEECLLGHVTQAADVFSLGVTVFEMLTGTRPFADGTRRNPYPQLTTEPVRLRSLLPGAPAGLERLLLSCLARDPDARPQLSSLLPALHAFIRRGPAMWPENFDPAGGRHQRARIAAIAA